MHITVTFPVRLPSCTFVSLVVEKAHHHQGHEGSRSRFNHDAWWGSSSRCSSILSRAIEVLVYIVVTAGTLVQAQSNPAEACSSPEFNPRPWLEDAATRLRSAIARSQEPCDHSSVWTEGTLKCTLLIGDVLFASGVLNYAPPGAFAALESRTTLFHPEFYTYSESSGRLPLYVVVDGDTWSAAEYFAAILQDNGAATILATSPEARVAAAPTEGFRLR